MTGVVQADLSILSVEQLQYALRSIRGRKAAGLMGIRQADQRLRMIRAELENRHQADRVRPYVKKILP